MLHPAEEGTAHTPVRRFNTDLMRWEAWLWEFTAWTCAGTFDWFSIARAREGEAVVSYEDTWAEPIHDA